MVELPYGSWSSPISAEDVGAFSGSLSWAGAAHDAVWWVQSDPTDGGRLALWRVGADSDAAAERVTAPGLNVRNRVHEYGGKPWAPIPGGAVVTNWDDQRLYAVTEDGHRPLTPAPAFEGQFRYAEPLVVGEDVWLLREEFFSTAPLDVRREFVAVPLDGRAADDLAAVRVLGGRHQFLAGLRVSPEGGQASWIGWDHPRMSWDGTELVVATIDAGGVGDAAGGGGFSDELVVAGSPTESIVQAEWTPDGSLAFLSDLSGWWNLHRIDPSGEREPVLTADREFGGALWRPGSTWFAVLGAARYALLDGGTPTLLDAATGALEVLPMPEGSGIGGWSTLVADGDRLVAIGSGSACLSRPVSWSRAGGTRTHGLLPAAPVCGGEPLGGEWLPRAESLRVPAEDGAGIPVHLFPPTNPDASAPASERPPYIVHVHGGPTGQKGTSLDLEIAYFTSRGIGVAVPEYAGSTGYGRAWRSRLNGRWGEADLSDAIALAGYLVSEGLADPARLVIRGGSAGGFTSAAAMTAPSPFAVGLISYPVIDLFAWMAGENHDLESQYLVGLVGPLPEASDRYRDRSPAERPERAHGPMLILQGLDDRICLPQTTERFVAGLRAAGKPHEYVGYPGEQHGFRMAATVADAIQREHAFLCRHLGIPAVTTESDRHLGVH